MSTVTPMADIMKEGIGGAFAGAPKVGSRIHEHIRLDRFLESSADWVLYLADDETSFQLVLVAIATSTDALDRCLSGPAKGTVLRRTTFESFQVADVAVDESHFVRFGSALLALQRETTRTENPTLASPSAQNEARLPDGSIFAERYRVEGLLGRGGMGEVYRAFDPIFQRPVALKIVRLDISEGAEEHREDAKRRLLNEARVVSALKHPHIVEVYDAGESAGLPYLVLELCDGGNLREQLEEGASYGDRLRWITEIAQALAHAHDQGIIHRDIKPENVILTRNSTAKVTDFGIAKALTRKGAANATLFSIVGTPRYMAPEQRLGTAVDARADQYAWGLVAYELLSGGHGRPHQAAPLPDDQADTSSPDVAPSLRRVFARATASDAGARYPDFHAVLADLQSAPPQRNRHIALGLAIALALASAGVATAFGSHARVGARGVALPAGAASSPLFDYEKTDAETVGRCAAAARAHLAAGLQLWRDASQWDALPKFEEATKVDPECASASLYYVMAANYTVPKRREHFRHARDHRSKLNGRERQLLDLLEPWLSDPPDLEEAARRASVVADEMPADPDVRMLQARALKRLERLDEALAVLDQASTFHSRPVPGFEYNAGRIQIQRRDIFGSFERFDRCLRVAPDSADCILYKGLVLASSGECSQAESTFRRLIAVMPQNEFAYLSLANVLLVSTRNAETARGVFEERWRRLTPDGYDHNPTPAVSQLSDELKLSIVAGDFAKALRIVREWNLAVATTNNGRFRGEPLIELIELLRELGHQDQARALALKGLREYRAWTADEYLDVGIELARLAYLTHAIDAKEYRRIRDEWLRAASHTPVEAWLSAYAGLPGVGGDMDPPIRPGEYAEDWLLMSTENFVRASIELVRVGRIQDAIQHVDAAANACLAFRPMQYVHAQVEVARVHDAAGDVPEACRRYASLRALFAREPGSPPYGLAVARMKALSCGAAVAPSNPKMR